MRVRIPWRAKSPDPTPSVAQRNAELATIQAVAAFLASDAPLPRLSLPDGHREDGLSGRRAWRMLSAHVDAREGRDRRGTPLLDEVRRSLRGETNRAHRRDAAHLRKLLAFATGLWAYRRAEARLAGLAASADEIAEAAEDAACMLRSEPYLRWLQARTLMLLGKADQAETLLAPLAGAPWLGNWQANIEDLLHLSRTPDRLLPLAGAEERLRAMSALPGWLEAAGRRLPELLREEAADRLPLVPAQPVFELYMSEDDLQGEEVAQRLIGAEGAGVETPTIRGLRLALNERFGIALPGVRMHMDWALRAGQAVVKIDGRRAGGTDQNDLAQADDAALWWIGAIGAHPALLALVGAALRHSHRLPPNEAAGSRAEDEARALMLADRMPYGLLAQPLRERMKGDIDPVSATAALRISLAQDTERGIPLWGNEQRRTLLLLDRTKEDELQKGIVPGIGLAIGPAQFRDLTGALRRRLDDSEATPALVVRNLALRPLLRALLADGFPDLPVLALAEVVLIEARVLVPLEEASAVPDAAAAPQAIAA